MKRTSYHHVMGSRNVGLELNTWYAYGGISLGNEVIKYFKANFRMINDSYAIAYQVKNVNLN